MKNKIISIPKYKEINDELLKSNDFKQSIIDIRKKGGSIYDIMEAVKSICQTKIIGSKLTLDNLHKKYFDLALNALKLLNPVEKEFIEADLFYTLGRKNDLSTNIPDEISDETYLYVVERNIQEGGSVYDTMFCASIIRPSLTSKIVDTILKTTKAEDLEVTEKAIKQAFNRSYETTDTEKLNHICTNIVNNKINLVWSRKNTVLEYIIKDVMDNSRIQTMDLANLMKENGNIYYVLYSALAYANKKSDFFGIQHAIDASLDSGANPYFTLYTAYRIIGKDEIGIALRLITEYSRKYQKFGQVNEMMLENALEDLLKNENIIGVMKAKTELKEIIESPSLVRKNN